MRGGEVFRQLRELVEVAEDNGQLFWSLNVSAVLLLSWKPQFWLVKTNVAFCTRSGTT